MTEGATCIALLLSGSAAAEAAGGTGASGSLMSLQAASIVAGFPMSISLSFYAMAIFRACKMVTGEIKTGHFDPKKGIRGYLLAPIIDPIGTNWKVFLTSFFVPC